MRQHFQSQSLQLSKRERTRSLLLDGAVATVAERGLGGASIKAITESVGLSNGTFYNHFETRDELVSEAAFAVAGALVDEIAEDVQSVESGIARVVRSTNAFIAKLSEQPDWAALLVDASRHLGEVRNDLGRHLRADVALALQQGELTERPSRFLVDQIGALNALAIEVQLRKGKSRAVRRQTCEAVLRLLGLPPDEARQAVLKAAPELEAAR
ncbi:MAG: TetR/AcrR family transcriptional regulator [Acidobacteriota bacterium]